MRTGAVRRAALVAAVLGVLVTGCGGSSGGGDSVAGKDKGEGEATSAGPLEPWDEETPDSTPSRSTGHDHPAASIGPTRKKDADGPTRDVRSSPPATNSGSTSPSSGPPASRTPPQEDREHPVKKCGITAPTGTKDGRRAQTVVFPALGTHHTYPHISAPLQGCATSGLPVVYTVDRAAQPASCALDPAENPTRVKPSGNQGGCTVVASQPGDSTWAPAPPVRQRFYVGYQPVTLGWADPQADLPYPGTLPLRITVKSPDPLEGYVVMDAKGSCDFGGDSTTRVYVRDETLVTATVTARDPGSTGKGGCELSAKVTSDHTPSSYLTLTQRTYAVIASTGGRTQSAAPSPS